MKHALSFAIVAVMCLASTVAADQGPFEGQVINPKSVPIHQAQVVLYRLDDPRQRLTTLTDEYGAFTLPLQDLVPTRPNTLLQNHPNPFNPSTLIPFQISERGHVRMDVYNILGQRVVTLIDEERPAGFHRVQWDGTDRLGRGVGAGVYIYRLSMGDWNDARKLMLLDGASGHAGGGAVSFAEEEARATYGVKISGEEIIPATFTWNPEHGPLTAEVKSLEDILPPEDENAEKKANPFSKTSLASIIQVVSGH